MHVYTFSGESCKFFLRTTEITFPLTYAKLSGKSLEHEVQVGEDNGSKPATYLCVFFLLEYVLHFQGSAGRGLLNLMCT